VSLPSLGCGHGDHRHSPMAQRSLGRRTGRYISLLWANCRGWLRHSTNAYCMPSPQFAVIILMTSASRVLEPSSANTSPRLFGHHCLFVHSLQWFTGSVLHDRVESSMRSLFVLPPIYTATTNRTTQHNRNARKQVGTPQLQDLKVEDQT
jgi:hypothetical protein